MYRKITDTQLLEEAISHGMIDSDRLKYQVEMIKRKEILKKHNEAYKCWEDNNGYWNTYLPTATGGRKRVKKRTKYEMDDIIIDHYISLEESPPIQEIYNNWIYRKISLKKIQPNTVDRYNCVFQRHFQELGEMNIDAMQPADWEYFMERQIVEYNLSSKGFSNLKTICRGLLLFAKKNGYISWNVTEMFDDMDLSERQFHNVVKESSDEVFNEAEAISLIRFLCTNPDNTNRAILLLYLTGMRVGEVVSIRKSDVSGNIIRIRHTESRVSKENANIDSINKDGLIESSTHYYYIKESPKTQAGNREVLIPKDFMWIMDDLINNSSSEFLFTNDTGERITTNVVRRRLEKINRKLGIKPKSPHKLRKTYASILLDNNLDNNLITSLMGHTDISMTEGHYHRDRKDQDKKNALVSNLVEFKAKTYGIKAQ